MMRGGSSKSYTLTLEGSVLAIYNRFVKIAFTLLALSGTLYLLSINPKLRWILLGPDYSDRLYGAIEVNLVLAVIVLIYLGIRKRWLTASVAGILALAWFWLGAVNSVV